LQWISESHVSDIDTIKDHIKYLLYQQQNESTNLKNNAQVQLYSIQDDHAKGIDKKAINVKEYQTRLKEVEISHNNFMFRLHRDYDNRIEKLREEFKRRFHIVTMDSEKNIKAVRDEKEARMKSDAKVLEEDKEKQAKIVEKTYEEVSAVVS
jgi:hypothetical protein